ncbi:MAG: protocatechuate 3,4-dioxygenase subunit alpha [Actinobacteria bacterium]|nr:protocatechuate 3,4-dioxygenase subunit alpha [Actinomycetota bacterium]
MPTTSDGRPGLTASQTVGPYLAIGLTWEHGEEAVDPGTPGAVTVSGTLYDGEGVPIPDGMVEIWQAHPDGRFHHPDDPRGVAEAPPGFRGFARAQTVDGGRWSVLTLVPGAVPGPDGTTQAPHLDVSVFARGLLDRVVTRVYFPEHAGVAGPGGHAEDRVLAAVPEHRRHTLVAQQVDGGYRFDIRLQGENETVFFDI